MGWREREEMAAVREGWWGFEGGRRGVGVWGGRKVGRRVW